MAIQWQNQRESFCVDVNPMKRSFYAACNSIFANTDGLNEMALLSLQEAYSLSILMYAAPALHLSVNRPVSWTSVGIRFFVEFFDTINGSLSGQWLLVVAD